MAAIAGRWYVSDAMGFTERTHTPVRPDYFGYVYSEQPDGRKYIVARCWSGDDSDYEGTARLIAAAPELLAALKVALSYADMEMHHETVNEYWGFDCQGRREG